MRTDEILEAVTSLEKMRDDLSNSAATTEEKEAMVHIKSAINSFDHELQKRIALITRKEPQ